MRGFIFSALLLLSIPAFSQYAKLSEQLRLAFLDDASRGKGMYKVVLVANAQPNIDSLNRSIENLQLTRKERGVVAVSYLKDFASKNQLRYAQRAKSSSDIRIEKSFWIVGLHIATVNFAGLNQLIGDTAIQHIEYTQEQVAIGHFPIPYKGPISRSPNGIEPGLDAVNSRFLWNLGYTGRGQKILNYDTGIWPNHPSFTGRFMGQRGPIEEAWFPFDQYQPADKANSHGTHTNGTSVGLDTINNDTIGMAFNSYFMATDPIVSNVADVRSVSELMSGYQWALDPDGDSNTSDDMPDVINNSWGRPYVQGDTQMCGTFVDNALLAVEAAGIISVQSAGNAGPGSGTVGFPAGNNPTLTANFAVGAVDASNPNWPIAGFSSRGPTTCGDTGALNIKPEVVAPGVGVRSAIRNSSGDYTYSAYQGTSMAGPHVAGIALLLAEAFPTASAKEIKEAMYFSATDLGDPGEDNVYGRGMVNGETSYNYLTQNHSPAVPNTSPYDADVTWTSLDNKGFVCSSESGVQVAIYQNEMVNASNAFLLYGSHASDTLAHSWSLTTLNQTDTIVLDQYSFTDAGWNDFFAHYEQIEKNESDEINNSRYAQVYRLHEAQLPYLYEFDEESWLQESEVYVHDEDRVITWDTAHVFTPSGDGRAAVMPMFSYSPRAGQIDGLVSSKITLPSSGARNLYVSFVYAYNLRFAGFADSVKVHVSADCGDNWTLVRSIGTEDLNTSEQPVQGAFVPADESDWYADTIDISQFSNSNEIIVRITTLNGGGNNLYLDRLQVFDDAGPASTTEVSDVMKWVIFPNPAQQSIQISTQNTDLVGERISLVSTLGVEVITAVISSQKFNLDISNLSAGVYFVTVGEETRKLIIE